MKKLLFPLFLLGIFTFSLQSCGEDDDPQPDDDPDTNVCDVCGTYNTQATGNVLLPSILDTTFTSESPLVLPATVSETSTEGELSLAVDLSNLTDLLTDPVTVTGTYDASTKVLTVTDQVYEYLIAEILINGTVDFNTANTADGSLTLGNTATSGLQGIEGSLIFSGQK